MNSQSYPGRSNWKEIAYGTSLYNLVKHLLNARKNWETPVKYE